MKPTAELVAHGGVLRPQGHWVLVALDPAPPAVPAATPASALECGGLDALDTAGALALWRLAQEHALEPRGLRAEFAALYEQVAELAARPAGDAPRPPGFLHRVGVQAVNGVDEARGFLAFIGELSATLVRAVAQPSRLRWRPMFAVFETAGWGALPILGLLSFLIGVVIAYQAGVQLRDFGANIFIADLIGLAVLREFGPLLAAIIVAGRTGSAFTAEIGTMKVTDEIDALRTIGVSPMEMLALPKVLALAFVLPLLTVFADILGTAGGMVMAQSMLGVGYHDFVDRLREAVGMSDFLTGIGKAPVFALLIASVGCHQGFQVGTSADSVGRHVTRSVVQSLFLIIAADAAFSILFSAVGL
jgi:phospholipid/cholesterol/gamma-HCH transport system permease protein